MTPEQTAGLALGIARSLTTEQIVAAFAATDVQIDDLQRERARQDCPDVTDRYLSVVGVRGWLMEVLEERGELALVMGEVA